jgi:DNA modification methylase
MPESVVDRCTKAHEYLFLLSKSPTYFYDANAISTASKKTTTTGRSNKRNVWSISPRAFPEAHFATFPTELVEPCVVAGCPAGGTVLDPFNGAGTTGIVALRLGRHYLGIELNAEYVEMSAKRILVDEGCR